MSRRVLGSEHTFCLPKVLDDNNLDFLQPHAGLHMLSLNINDRRQMGHDFQVANAACSHASSDCTDCTVTGCTLHKCAGYQLIASSISLCLQGLTHLTELMSLTISMYHAIDSKAMSAIAGLTTLKRLSITAPRLYPYPLSAIR